MIWTLFTLVFVALLAALGGAVLAGSPIGRNLHRLAGWSAAALALAAGVLAMLGHTLSAHVPLSLLGSMLFTLNPLRGFFIVIAACVYAATLAGATAGAGREPPRRAVLFLTLYTVLFAALLAVLTAGDVLSFIFTWEIMSLALWGLVSFRIEGEQRWRASLSTIAFSEAGTIAGLAGLLILAAGAGSPDLAVIAQRAGDLPPAIRWTGFLLTFYGFGVKTGIAPVNLWMNDGYAAAPPAARALFSGATINLGVFALWTIDGPLAIHEPWMGLLVLVTGAVTALLGILYAILARDIGRLLTESSIENLGIVVAASGAGFAFVAYGHPVLGAIALVAGLYHMLNHSAFKTLLFLGADGIEQTTGTANLDQLGGLMRRVPMFATAFLIGTIAIAALPPFNGFVSEWLVLESLLRVVAIASVPVRLVFALSGALLALTAGLALTCFVSLAGTALLGRPRSSYAANARVAPMSASLPMWLLAGVCLALGVSATAVIPLLGALVHPLAGADPTNALVPAFFGIPQGLPAGLATALSGIGAEIGRGVLPLRSLVVVHSGGAATPVVFAMSTALAFAVITIALLCVWLAVRLLRGARTRRVRAWDAGLSQLQPEMLYTATAFSAPVRVLFDTLLHPIVDEQQHQHGVFRIGLERETRLVHVAERWTLRPLVAAANAASSGLARMHRGRVTLYAAFILSSVVLALLLAAALMLIN
ncbi:hydrogenase-4 component B [bacterium BMS3Bbin12]|nr:hydrogenase-4 component B [bacterium BMS3Bbin12]GBE50673.1 hydrogenase-4 component B [bacterium BMS3Bbin13]